MDLRPHDTTQQGKSSMMRHQERSEESGVKRPIANPLKRAPQDDKRPFRRLSPSIPRITGSFKPGFRGRFFRPRFIRDDRMFRKPAFSFGLQRFNSFSQRPRAHWRDQLGPPAPNSRYSEQRNLERSSSAALKDQAIPVKSLDTNLPRVCKAVIKAKGTPRSSTSSSREREKQKEKEKEKQPLSFTVSLENEGGNSRERDLPYALSRAAARNRAIQQKRREIEEVYHQDCDTFGVVVKMLISKDPALESSIQASLQDNLRDIGLRCVEAMQQFIEEYDAKEPSP